jgi:signal transduction histidine kinase
MFALGAPFLLAILIAFTHRQRTLARENTAPYVAAEAARLDPINARFEAETVDLELAVGEAAAAVSAQARTHSVRIDKAVSAAIEVHVDPNALGAALRETMQAAIRATPGGQVLVTAVTLGSQLQIRVTDDGPGADQVDREIAVRGAQAMIALQGGSIVVEACPGRGTTVTVRLPVPGKTAGHVCPAMQLHVLAG